MTARTKPGILFILFAVLVTSIFTLNLPDVKEAHAIIGRPLTPLSYAGVARRTTRRAVYADAYGGYGGYGGCGGGYGMGPAYGPYAPYYW